MSKIHHIKFNLWANGLVLFVSVSIWTTAGAYDWNNDYGVNATVGRNDNYRLTEDDPIATTSTSAGVFADLRGATETSDIGFKIDANGTTHSESSIEDSEKYHLGLTTARRGERWSGNLNLSYDLTPTTETEELDTGRLVDGEKKSTNAGAGVSYQLNERNSIYTNISFTDATYDTVSLTDYSNSSVAVGWVNQFSETSQASLNANASEYDPGDGDTTIISGLNIGYGFNASEATHYNIQLGYQESDSPSETVRDGNSSFAISHSLDERNNFSLFVGSGYEASGRGETRYQSRLNLGWNHALAEKWQSTLTAQGVTSDDRDYIRLVAGGSYLYSREIKFTANYRYRKQQRDTSDADSNSVSISLNYSPI